MNIFEFEHMNKEQKEERIYIFEQEAEKHVQYMIEELCAGNDVMAECGELLEYEDAYVFALHELDSETQAKVLKGLLNNCAESKEILREAIRKEATEMANMWRASYENM